MRSGQLCRNRTGKGLCGKPSIGSLMRPVCSDASPCPFVFGDKDIPFLGCRENTSHMGVLLPILEEEQKEGHCDLPTSVF